MISGAGEVISVGATDAADGDGDDPIPIQAVRWKQLDFQLVLVKKGPEAIPKPKD